MVLKQCIWNETGAHKTSGWYERMVLKMKAGIARRLSLYFLSVILLFSVVIGVTFIFEFRSHTVEIYKDNLMQKAENIASTYSGNITGSGGMRGYGAFSRFISDIAMADVWIIDSDGNAISGKMGNGMGMYSNTKELPTAARDAVSVVLSGKKSVGEGFSSVYQKQTLTVGVPVYDNNQKIIGAVFLSSPMNGVENAANGGIFIMLVSIGAAILLTLVLGIILSRRFTKPLLQMNEATKQLSGGHYDITVKTTQKDEIGELSNSLEILSKQLEHAAHQAENLEKMRRNFITNISHELRTPVTVIRAISESLRDNMLPEGSTEQDCFAQIVSESSSLQRLIGDLLELSRLQNPDFNIQMEFVDMHAVLQDSLRGIGNMAHKKGIRLLTDLQVADYSVWGDYDRLRQLINIILDNAVKFTPEGKEITVKSENADHQIKVTIADEGCGMTEEETAHIFNRFYRTQNGQNRSGSGLGLAIAREIADRHHIQVNATSMIGKGTIFQLSIPLLNSVPHEKNQKRGPQ